MKKVLLIICAQLFSTLLIASESSVYEFSWLDKDKEIYVLQNRRFRKAGKVYLGGTGVKTISGAFIDSYGGTARAGFFFSEDWGIELVYGKASGKENTTAKGVQSQQADAFYRKVDGYVGGMLMWSPFYSKINTFNQVFYYDWMFGVGAASVNTQDNRKDFDTPGFQANAEQELTSENNMGLLWNTGLRFYLNDNWSIRLDFTGIHAKPAKPAKIVGNDIKTNVLFNNYDLGVGLNYAF